MTVASATAPSLAGREVDEPSFRAIFAAGAPRFVRELFGPVLAFYLASKLGGLVVGIPPPQLSESHSSCRSAGESAAEPWRSCRARS